MAPATRRIEPIGWPATAAVAAVAAVMLVCAWSVFGLVREIATLREGAPIRLDAYGTSIFFLPALTAVAFALVAAMPFVLIWAYRAWSNVAARGLATGVRWWLVPLVPLSVIATIWRGSAPGAVRDSPLRVYLWWAGELVALAILVVAIARQPTFDEAWSCTQAPGEDTRACLLTEAGRDAWIATDVTLSALFASQVALGALLLATIVPVNRMQRALVEAETAGSRDGLWEALRTDTRA